MTLNDLKNELLNGPRASTTLAPYLASGDDGAIAAVLNEKNIPAHGLVDVRTFAIWAAQSGMRAVIEDISTTPRHPLRSIALALRDVLGGLEGVDFSRAENLQMLDAWVAGGALSEANKAALLALAQTPISRAEQLWGRGVYITPADVGQALRG